MHPPRQHVAVLRGVPRAAWVACSWLLGGCALLALTRLTAQRLMAAQLQARIVRQPAAPPSPRNIFVDTGAGWGTTLRLFRDLARERAGRWEVYAFERNPLIQPYLDKFVHHLNGKGARPLLMVPPMGSTSHLAALASRYGCPALKRAPDGAFSADAVAEERMRRCLLQAFKKPLSKLAPKAALQAKALLEKRIAQAKSPHRTGRNDRYTFIPAAVGAENGTLHLRSVHASQLIHGRDQSHDSMQGVKGGVEMEVPMVDLANWMADSFSEDDFVFLRLDAEGLEVDIVERLLKHDAASRVKLIEIECHPSAGSCPGLADRISRDGRIKLVNKKTNLRDGGWDSFSGPEIYHPVDPRPAPKGGRNVFLDMGANWANTLRLYKDLAAFRRGPWEVYAFEASPLIQPYVEEFVRHLNGRGPKPPLLIPPAGSTAHLRELAKRYDCFARNSTYVRECMWELFKEPLARLKPDPELNNSNLIAARMAESQTPVAAGQPDRFTFIPAAVGAANGMLHLGRVDAKQMIRGGAHSGGADTHVGVQMDVPLVDTATWIEKSFTEKDFVFLKMDVEGAEFAIMSTLMDHHRFNTIKLLAFECHAWAGSCEDLQGRIIAETQVTMLGEKAYGGWDSLSGPDVYYPEDPRQVTTPMPVTTPMNVTTPMP